VSEIKRLSGVCSNQNLLRQKQICKEFLKTTLFKNCFRFESKLLSERSEGGNLSGSMVPSIGASSNQKTSEASVQKEMQRKIAEPP